MAAFETDFRKAVVYQVYVKSFCDSDGDGLGDLPGITSKLDYLKHLGIDYLWLTPFYPSPQRDNGYDVSDYCAVDPAYGTMADFEELVAQARDRGIGIMLDMVLCHTSAKHEWFRRALMGEKRFQDYYILRDGRGSSGPGDPGEPPTNWQCAFGGSAWEWVPRLGKWYLHLHDRSQPDLNWENPEVRDALVDVVRFWKDKGVSGFRFDVVNLISKPAVFEDDTTGQGRRLFADGPHVHEFLKELVDRAGIDGMMTVGEMAATNLKNCVRYTNPAEHELGQVFTFHHLKVDYKDGQKWALQDPDIAKLREVFRLWQEGMQAGGGCNALFWCNHDQPRAITRFGGREGVGQTGGSWEKVGKMLALCTHLMQGVPYIFQGEEIGTTNAGFTSIDQFRDVETLNNYNILLGQGKTPAEALHIVNERSRDNGRTPMQWTGEKNAGFSTGTPWIGLPGNYDRVNVEAEMDKPGSLWSFYRELIRLRKEHAVISQGSVRFVDAGSAAPKVIAYERAYEGVRLLVLCSFDGAPCRATCEDTVFRWERGQVLIGNYDTPQVNAAGESVDLRPYEAVALIERA